MPATKPVVFLSSTAADLKPYREAAAEAARQAGFYDVRMEDFEAQSAQKPYPACMAKVRECDVLVVIIAHRYGWVPPDQPDPKDAKSITWLECEEALKHGREILAFVIADQHDWPKEHKEAYRAAEAIEKGNLTPKLQKEIERNVKKLAEFKAWINSLGFRRTFTTTENLEKEIHANLSKWKDRKPKSKTKTKTNAKPSPTINLDPYYAWLEKQTGKIEMNGLRFKDGRPYVLDIEQLYTPLMTLDRAEPKAQRLPQEQKRQQKRVPLEQALTGDRVLIQGAPGSGKSTFLRWHAHRLCRARATLPFFIRISDLARYLQANEKRHPAHSPAWLTGYLQEQNASFDWGLPASFFEQRLKKGDALLLLDGLDEAPGARLREHISAIFRNATQTLAPCRFVVTTRPHGYQGDLAGFDLVEIQGLGEEEIHQFLDHFQLALEMTKPEQQQFRDGLNAALRREEVGRMATNPVMLTALAVLQRNGQRLPEFRAQLYDRVIDWLVEFSRGRTEVTKKLCLTRLRLLALAMQDAGRERVVQMNRREAARLLMPDDVEAGVEFLDQEERESGVIVTLGQDLRFWHLSFQEYLAARQLATEGDPAKRLKLLLKDGKAYRPEWREVMRLLGGILHDFGPTHVETLFVGILKEKGTSLAAQTRRAAVLGAMLRDLERMGYQPTTPLFIKCVQSVAAFLKSGETASVDALTRCDAAEALGRIGDPRLRLPQDDDYWARIPAGQFTMGEGKEDDEKSHLVQLSAYRIGCHPVTVHEYALFLAAESTYQPPPDWEQQSAFLNRPVVSVTWHDAQAYCQWANVRLPTEAEWERAARGKQGRRYPWGNTEPTPELANYNLSRIGHASPVGAFPMGCTPAGIADLAGNVWEWCADWYGKEYYKNSPKENPKGPKSGGAKCLRGGSWGLAGKDLRAAGRDWVGPDDRDDFIGFRCAQE